jgi:DNA-binding NarL/FixJ family response regulator
MNAKRIRVLLAEDHQVVREGLRALLAAEPDLEVIGEAADGLQAIRMAETLGPDVVVMDIGLPGLNGIEATSRLHQSRPETRVVILSMHDDSPTVDRALRAGARGYVLKGDGFAALRDAIRHARAGEVSLSPGVCDLVVSGYLRAGGAEADPLTSREREVLQLIAEGYTSAEIAGQLELKPKTVENHRQAIMEKLGIHTTAGLVRYALRTGVSR